MIAPPAPKTKTRRAKTASPKPAAAAVRSFSGSSAQHPPTLKTFSHSPHVLDISGMLPRDLTPKRKPQRPAVFRAFDEQIHLQDLSVRSLSVRPKGLHDFPPKGATSLMHAIAMTVRALLNDHPLADLTIVSLLHLAALSLWHLIGKPFARTISRATESADERRLSQLQPIIVVAPAADESATAIEKEHVLSDRTRESALETPPAPWILDAFGITAAAVLFVLPFSAYTAVAAIQGGTQRLMDEGKRGVELLTSAADDLSHHDFSAAKRNFDRAASDFADIRAHIGVFGAMLASASRALPGGSSAAASAPQLVIAAEAASRAGSTVASTLATASASRTPVEKILALESGLTRVLPLLERANAQLAKVSPAALPAPYAASVTDAQSRLPALTATVRTAVDSFDALLSAIGAAGTKRYLVVFQNNAELRPTGGFIGSFALIDIDKGAIKKMEIPGGGSYDLKGSLALRLASPQPLHLVNSHWQFQDANWSPDFPTSARTLERFYEKSGGPTVDGVIAINQSVMVPLLAAVGPVAMPEYGKTITADNFYAETQKAVELDYDRTKNKPKQFIADLAPKVIAKVLAADDKTLIAVMAALHDAFNSKDVQMYFRDERIQSRVVALGWDGALKSPQGDYLAIVHANIAGQKSDLAMKDVVTHEAQLLPDGSSIVTLTMQRTHAGKKGDLFSGVRNVDYARVFVPAGSSLIEATGFSPPDPKLFKLSDPRDGADTDIAAEESTRTIDRASGTNISLESGKTVFGNWIQTEPGATSVATLVYRTPAGTAPVNVPTGGASGKMYDALIGHRSTQIDYQLTVQRQSGAPTAAFTSLVVLPRNARFVQQSPVRARDDRDRWSAALPLTRDMTFASPIELP